MRLIANVETAQTLPRAGELGSSLISYTLVTKR